MLTYVVSIPYSRRSSYCVPMTLIVQAKDISAAIKDVQKRHTHLLDNGFTIAVVGGE